jgi:hypothetical protein
MNLGEVREWFIEITGRQDLVDVEGKDSGAGKYINAGQRFLDRRIDFKKASGVYFKSLAANDWYLKLGNCRTLEKVWVNDTEERWELEKKDLLWLHNEYPDLISETDAGEPLYWSPAILRGIRVGDVDVQGSFFNFVQPEMGNEDLVGLVILPPSDVAVVMELWGKFYSPLLENDYDETYWSVVVPETLVKAAAYQLEISYRNTEGARDWLGAIDVELMDLFKDEVEEETANVDQLEG